MPEFLRTAFADAPPSDPLDVLIRLALAVVLGVLVSAVYRLTRQPHEVAPTFPGTLVLLAVLIAMVTQVIGDNVARAFSLVGALSIVRFRTVVRDTQDTAFVIFAVVVGMAIGARDLVVSGIGLLVVGVAAIVMRPRAAGNGRTGAEAPFQITLRVGLGHDIEALVGPVLDQAMTGRQLVFMATAKQGMSVDACYRGALRSTAGVEALVKALNRIEGVQSVEIAQRTQTEE